MEDFLPIKRVDHVELYVGNARQAAHYYEKGFGFANVAYSGLETGNRDFASYVMEQGKIRLVLSTPLGPDHPMTRFLHLHGDGASVVGLEVIYAPGYQPRNGYGNSAKGHQGHKGLGLASVDHIVGNVELGAMNRWVQFFADTMGFSQLIHFDDQDISTEYSALMSKVMQDGTGKVKFPINEPAEGKKKSQIQEYLDFNYGPGVQHIALSTGDIIETVGALEANGVEFLRVPHNYYETLQDRVGKIDEPVEKLAELGVLVDRDEEGYLLQIFSKPMQDRPTLFFEVIERRGSRGFGKGNFKALFEALEHEQELRGNL